MRPDGFDTVVMEKMLVRLAILKELGGLEAAKPFIIE